MNAHTSLTNKIYSHGTDRVVDPETTLERVRPIMRDLQITRVANITGLDRIGVPVVAVCRPNSRSVVVAQGKGLTLAAAKASGVMESIEGFHAERIESPVIMARHAEIQRSRETIALTGLPRTSLADADVHGKRLWIGGRRCQTVRDLGWGQEVWVPYDVVHTDYSLPFPPGAGTFLMSSNGLASGNHLLEAVSHGICELVERDACALWAVAPNAAKRDRLLDLATVADPTCRAVLERFAEAAINVRVWETTCNVGIASFRCAIGDRPEAVASPMHVVAGAGCHPRREVALLRALTEAAQGRLTVISGGRDDLHAKLYDAEQAEREVNEMARACTQEPGRRKFDDVATREHATIAEDVDWELAQLKAVGLKEVVVVDLSKPRYDCVSVVRVVIPGLEGIHDAPGFAAGERLQGEAARWTSN